MFDQNERINAIALELLAEESRMNKNSRLLKRTNRVRRDSRQERRERVKALLQQGKSIRAVAGKIGCDEKTVRLDLKELNKSVAHQILVESSAPTLQVLVPENIESQPQ